VGEGKVAGETPVAAPAVWEAESSSSLVVVVPWMGEDRDLSDLAIAWDASEAEE
jgi:hypothetical protein